MRCMPPKLPGFYFDEQRGRYFRLGAAAAAAGGGGASYTPEAARHAELERERKRTKTAVVVREVVPLVVAPPGVLEARMRGQRRWRTSQEMDLYGLLPPHARPARRAGFEVAAANGQWVHTRTGMAVELDRGWRAVERVRVPEVPAGYVVAPAALWLDDQRTVVLAHGMGGEGSVVVEVGEHGSQSWRVPRGAACVAAVDGAVWVGSGQRVERVGGAGDSYTLALAVTAVGAGPTGLVAGCRDGRVVALPQGRTVGQHPEAVVACYALDLVRVVAVSAQHVGVYGGADGAAVRVNGLRVHALGAQAVVLSHNRWQLHDLCGVVPAAELPFRSPPHVVVPAARAIVAVLASGAGEVLRWDGT